MGKSSTAIIIFIFALLSFVFSPSTDTWAEGSSMQELDQLIDWFEKVAETTKENNNQSSCDLGKLLGVSKIEDIDIDKFKEIIGECDDWFYGTNTAQKNKDKDINEMFTEGAGCGMNPISVGLCIECAFPPTAIKPKYSYYLPVHTIEVTEYPGHTAYALPSFLKDKMSKNSLWTRPLLLTHVLANLHKKYNKYNNNHPDKSVNVDGKTASEFLQKRDGIATDHLLWSSTKSSQGSVLHTHIFDTGFHNKYKSTYPFNIAWGHDGNQLAWKIGSVVHSGPERHPKTQCPRKCENGNKKRSVSSSSKQQGWFSESIMDVWHYPIFSIDKASPKSSQKKIKAISFKDGNPYTQTAIDVDGGINNYGKQILKSETKAYKSNKSPEYKTHEGENACKEKYDEKVMGERLSKCLHVDKEDTNTHRKIVYPAKGPIVGFVPEQSHPRAALTALWRGLFWVNAYEDDHNGGYTAGPADLGVTNSSLDDDCNAIKKLKFHPFYNEDKASGALPRSKLQILTNNSTRYNNLKGCSKFESHKQFIPALSFTELYDMTKNDKGENAEKEIFEKEKNHGNNTRYVQWNYFKNCTTHFTTFIDRSGQKDVWY